MGYRVKIALLLKKKKKKNRYLEMLLTVSEGDIGSFPSLPLLVQFRESITFFYIFYKLLN